MEKFNENIQQLFNKAKNAPPPVSIEEAEAVVTAYKQGFAPSPSFWAGAKGILLLAVAAAALCLAYFAVQGVGNGGADSSRISQNAQQAGIVAEAGKGKEIINSDKGDVPLNNTPGNTENKVENLSAVGKITVTHKTPERADNKGEIINKDKLVAENIPQNFITGKPEKMPAADDDKDPEIFEEPGIIKAFGKTEQEEPAAAIDTVLPEKETDDKKVNKKRDFVVAEPYWRRNFIKTDLAGYFYKLATPYKSVPGTKFSIAYERLFTRHLSAGIGFSTGPIWPGANGSGSFTDNTGNWMFEQARTAKGWILNIDARYYFGRRGTSRGFFAGIYYNHTEYTENTYYRAFRDKSQKPGFDIISSSKGNWNVYGISTGYRFLPGGKFIVEPLIGMAQGLRSIYYPNNYQSTVIISAFRLELNIGYAF
jgi:hypothetical protein